MVHGVEQVMARLRRLQNSVESYKAAMSSGFDPPQYSEQMADDAFQVEHWIFTLHTITSSACDIDEHTYPSSGLPSLLSTLISPHAFHRGRKSGVPCVFLHPKFLCEITSASTCHSLFPRALIRRGTDTEGTEHGGVLKVSCHDTAIRNDC